MKALIRTGLLFSLAAFLFAGSIDAQENRSGEPTPDVQRPAANQPQDVRANMLRQLGLSREQIQQLRRINAERQPHMENAQTRLRIANRALDEAIYADQVNEADVQVRLREMQLAQAEVIKIRFINELAVRRILTPEQLVRFRNMRQRFERAREEAENSRRANGVTPVRNGNTFQESKPAAKPVTRPNQRPD